MKSFLSTLVVLATAAASLAQSKPPQAPPLAFGLTVAGQGIGIDAGSKTVTVPPDWKVVAQKPTPPVNPKATVLPAPKSAVSSDSIPYEEVRRLVKAGTKVLLLVRTDPTVTTCAKVGFVTLRSDDAPMATGVYACSLKDGNPVMEVAGSRPFAAASVPSTTTPATSAQRARGVSLSLSGSIQTGRTLTSAPPTAPAGTTDPNCPDGRCGAPQGDVPIWRPFGGIFRR